MGEGAICGETPPVCDTCKAETPSFRSCMSCWLHRGVGREIVLALKYRQADFLKNDIARLLESNCQDACRFADNAILVPVPINYLRRLGRGYNQTTVIAQAVAKVTDGTEVVNMLSSKPRKSQTKLARNERLLNVKNTFECLPGISSIPKDSRIVLVDDVQTSGATADECCRVLRGVGFENLHVWTLSYG
jgi:ComF family protein